MAVEGAAAKAFVAINEFALLFQYGIRRTQGEDEMNKMILVLACAVLAACGGKQQAPPQADTVQQPKTALPKAIQQALPTAAVPSPSAGTAAVGGGAAPQSADVVTGEVVETMNAAGYTYVRIATASGDRWAAVRETPVKKGANVSVAVQMVAENFESKTLNRKFDHIIFGTIAGGPVAGTAPPQGGGMMAATPMGTPSEHMRPQTDLGDVKVEKAANGSTIAEVWSGKSAFQDKPVTIRGKIVKFLPDILGKNWVHLRDGSGSRQKGDDDITITTNDAAKVGQIVTITGTLRVDKDFGAGYRYPVIVEDAKLQK